MNLEVNIKYCPSCKKIDFGQYIKHIFYFEGKYIDAELLSSLVLSNPKELSWIELDIEVFKHLRCITTS